MRRNSRGRCRHTPQAVALSWGYDLESTYPSSIYRYNYVLATDVVYHHDFLGELLATMKHFCKPGTTLIWANKVRFESDLTFTENFKKAFHASLLCEDGDIKIFMGTCREEEGGSDTGMEIREEKEENEKNKEKFMNEKHDQGKGNDNEVTEERLMLETERRNKKEHECDEEKELEKIVVLTDDNCKEGKNDRGENNHPSCSTTTSDEDLTGESPTCLVMFTCIFR